MILNLVNFITMELTNLLTELHKDLEEKNFTDVEIILTDGCNEKSIHIHKVILASSSQYFRNLFLFGKERDQKQIRINVTNVKISYKIIMSFYGIIIDETDDVPKWKQIFDTIRCQSFFSLQIDLNLLYDIHVPAEGFNELLEMIDIFNISDKKMLATIKRNIPLDYDLANLSFDFVKSIVDSQNRLLTIGDDGYIRLWNTDTLEMVSFAKANERFVMCMDISMDREMVATGGKFDSDIKFWSTNNLELIHTIHDAHMDPVSSLAFSPTQNQIVSCGGCNIIKIWCTKNFNMLGVIDCSFVRNIIFDRKGETIMVRDHNGVICYNSETKRYVNSVHYANDVGMDLIFAHHADYHAINSGHKVIVHLMGKASYDNVCVLYHKTDVNSIAFSPDDTKIACGCVDGSINIWNVADGHLRNTIITNRKNISCMTYTADGKYIVVGYTNGMLGVWDVDTGYLVNKKKCHIECVNCIRLKKNTHDTIDKKLLEYLNKNK